MFESELFDMCHGGEGGWGGEEDGLEGHVGRGWFCFEWVNERKEEGRKGFYWGFCCFCGDDIYSLDEERKIGLRSGNRSRSESGVGLDDCSLDFEIRLLCLGKMSQSGIGASDQC